jgi:small subunit ribosomal protein S6
MAGHLHGKELQLRQYAPEPRTYELMTILSPDVTDENIPSAVETVGSYISSNGGELQETLTDSPWGRRRLAYAIRHGGRDLRDGFYALYHFLAQPGAVGEIERELKLNTDIIRYLVTRYEPVPVEELSPEEAEIAAEDEAATAYAAAQAPSDAETEQPPAEATDARVSSAESEDQADAAVVTAEENAPQQVDTATSATTEGDESGSESESPSAEAATDAAAPSTDDTAGTDGTDEDGADESAKES